jgi:hypothetical protein
MKDHPHTPYQPDLSPGQFLLHLKLRQATNKKVTFPNMSQAQSLNLTAQFKTINFTKGFERWHDRWARILTGTIQ